MKNSTSPEGLGHVLDPRGLESEFEPKTEVKEVVVSTRERLLAAQKAAEEASRELEAAQRARLEELGEKRRLVVSSYFNGNSKEARKLLSEGVTFIVRALDGSGTTAVLEPYGPMAAKGPLSWGDFRSAAAELVAEVQQSGVQRFISYRGKIVASLRVCDSEDAEYIALSSN